MLFSCILLFSGMINNTPSSSKNSSFEEFAHAIHQVETNGRLGPILSDNGRALGPLCITKSCWEDVKNKIGYQYSNCADLDYSKKVLYFYCLKYEKNDILLKNWESCAKLWNAGPNWRKKSPEVQQKLNNYWKKIKKKLKIL